MLKFALVRLDEVMSNEKEDKYPEKKRLLVNWMES